jgi:uncharacterized ferredoxin-like protein
MISGGKEMEEMAVETVASLMCAAARTAPKARGVDNLVTMVITGDDLKKIADEMKRISKKEKIPFFERDAKCVESSNAIVLLGQRPVQLNIPVCGFCGFKDCSANVKAGGNCAISAGDLGIALSSAVAVAAVHHIDNRIMFSIGRAALNLGLFEDKKVTIAYGIPLSVSGKSPYFDR